MAPGLKEECRNYDRQIGRETKSLVIRAASQSQLIRTGQRDTGVQVFSNSRPDIEQSQKKGGEDLGCCNVFLHHFNHPDQHGSIQVALASPLIRITWIMGGASSIKGVLSICFLTLLSSAESGWRLVSLMHNISKRERGGEREIRNLILEAKMEKGRVGSKYK